MQTGNYIQIGFGKMYMGNNSQERSIEAEKSKNTELSNAIEPEKEKNPEQRSLEAEKSKNTEHINPTRGGGAYCAQ